MNKTAWLVFRACYCGSLLFVGTALHFWGAAEIRGNFSEVVFLTLICAGWLFVAIKIFAWFGVSLRDDAIERRNGAALIVLCAAILAAALIYAGGNVGEGPSYMNNIFSAGLGIAGFFALWLVLEIGADISRSIAEERDMASGARVGGFLLAVALVLARAVAGDWHSEAATLRDFVNDGWFVLVLGAIAVPTEHFTRPTRKHPFRQWQVHGLLPALVYLALAGGWLWYLGPWEGMPR